ncbi:MAG: hypothetical protein J6A50_04605 [Clostridia bacterium]|nr:hypothetical protein [Clostridia bacterium]
MKKLYCIGLALLLCLSICGCNKVPRVSDNNAETIRLEHSGQLQGDVVEVFADGLSMKVSSCNTDEVEYSGDIVYVITDETDWCVEDEIVVDFYEAKIPHDESKPMTVVANLIKAPSYVAKPIIYLYPEAPTECSVEVSLNGQLTCTYPDHGINGWQKFTAYPDGTLTFPDGKEYYALYWEGLQNTQWDFSEGWCVRGEDTAKFLEWALAEQGLTQREANEFIVYWLPLMQDNPYNVISFQTTAYTDGAVLEISPTPDSLLRVFMAYYPSDNEVELAPQSFDNFTRQGFTAVEWGGCQTSKP